MYCFARSFILWYGVSLSLKRRKVGQSYFQVRITLDVLCVGKVRGCAVFLDCGGMSACLRLMIAVGIGDTTRIDIGGE